MFVSINDGGKDPAVDYARGLCVDALLVFHRRYQMVTDVQRDVVSETFERDPRLWCTDKARYHEGMIRRWAEGRWNSGT